MTIITRRKILVNAFRTGLFSLTSSLLPGIDKAYALNNKATINVGYLPITDHLILPVSHALDNKNYKDIVVRPHLCRSWDELLGKLDMGLLNAAFILAPLAMHTFREKNLRCILLGHRNGSVIAASPEIQTAKDLSNVNIGIPHPRSTHSALLYKYFKDHGITDFRKLKLKKVAPPLTVAQVKSGVIRGYSVAEPWGIRGVNDGTVRILEYSKNILPSHACCIVMIHKHFLQRHLEAVAEWVGSLQMAGEFIHKDPENAAQLQKTYMGHSADDILQILKSDVISYRSLAPDTGTLQALHDLALESGLIRDRVQLSSFIDPRFAG